MIGSSGADRAAAREALVERGHAALAHGAWNEARSLFEAAVEGEDFPEAFEGLGRACWWLDDVAAVFDAHEKAYRIYRDRGDARAAARVALALADDADVFRGEAAVANGWAERARRLLTDVEESPEHGRLAARDAFIAFAAGEMDAAHAHAHEAIAVAARFGWFDLETWARTVDGAAYAGAGDIANGIPLLDEAGVAAISGEMHDVDLLAQTCCTITFVGERTRDFRRAAEWCQRIRAYFEARGLASLVSLCRAHYAMVTAALGDFDTAEAELLGAAERLAIRPGDAADATARLGELRRRQGRHAEAEQLLRQAQSNPEAQAWLAALHVDRGEFITAIEWAERYLRQVPPTHGLIRTYGYETLARGHAALGEFDAARQAVSELTKIADAVGTPLLKAAAADATAIVDLAAGDLKAAQAAAEDAIDVYARTRMPYESGYSHLLLARVFAAQGDDARARAEAAHALELFQRIGAAFAAEQARAVLGRTGDRPRAGDLTPREVEVLRLIGDGLSDKEIALRLGLSAHTVHRHVSNILAKLRAPSRAAALRLAAKNQLV